MKATGEVMAIDRSFEAALQKAVRSLEIGSRDLLWEDARRGPPTQSVERADPRAQRPAPLGADGRLAPRRDARDARRAGSGIDPFFLDKLRESRRMRARRCCGERARRRPWLRRAKRLGFSDRADRHAADETARAGPRPAPARWDIRPVYKMVDTCAAEFEAVTPYFYCTYETENEALPLPEPKVVVIGSGPIRIGQGIEFDYCSVRAAMALRERGRAEHHDQLATRRRSAPTSTRRPALLRAARRRVACATCWTTRRGATGRRRASLASSAGRRRSTWPSRWSRAGYALLGSRPATRSTSPRIATCSSDLLDHLGIPQPPGRHRRDADEARRDCADQLGYPVLVRPSFVLGGRAMEICPRRRRAARVTRRVAKDISGKQPLPDRQVPRGRRDRGRRDLRRRPTSLIPGIMEHVERAGVHSGDSMAVYPAAVARAASCRDDRRLHDRARPRARRARAVQHPVRRRSRAQVYVIEVNPRGSRTVPFL